MVMIFNKAKYKKMVQYQIEQGELCLEESHFIKSAEDVAEMKGFISGLKVALQILERYEDSE